MTNLLDHTCNSDLVKQKLSHFFLHVQWVIRKTYNVIGIGNFQFNFIFPISICINNSKINTCPANLERCPLLNSCLSNWWIIKVLKMLLKVNWKSEVTPKDHRLALYNVYVLLFVLYQNFTWNCFVFVLFPEVGSS